MRPPTADPLLLPMDTGRPRRQALTLGVTAATRAVLGRQMFGWSWVAGLPPALALTPPKGPVMLSVIGDIHQRNAAQRADFDMAMLEAMPRHQFSTGTPWFNTPRKFSGPLLRDVLAAAGAKGKSLRAIALNNYKVDIPMEDAQRFRMLIATRMDDRPMAVRDKGPLFIVYPYDELSELRNERYYARSAWQLRTIEVS